MEARPYKINGSWDVESCVIKVHFGHKYVVIKAKKQLQALQALEKTVAAYIRGNEPNPAGMYYHLLLYVREHRDNTFRVETILESSSGYELLKAEQMALDEGRHDNRCLNNNTDAYVPNWNEETQSRGWITQNDYLNYMKWRKHGRKRPKKKSSA